MKAYRSYDEQAEVLVQRGMDVGDRDDAAGVLQRINYYRLSGYWYPFLRQTGTGRDDTFYPGTRLADVVALNEFDARLRAATFSALAPIELAFRANHGPLPAEPLTASSRRGSSERDVRANRPVLIRRRGGATQCSIMEHVAIDMRSLGQRVADARLRAGLTQAQLATDISLARSTLAKIELGDRRVTALELARIAEAVGERVEWFFDDAPVPITSHRNALDPGQPSPQIDKTVERRAREVEFVLGVDSGLDLAPLETVSMPADADGAETLAAEARSLLGIEKHGPLHSLERHVVRAGVLPFVVELGPDSADAASILLDRGAVVVVNGSLKVGRRRLSLAHEFGHVLVADDYTVDWRVAAEQSVARREGRIDRFARALLVPADDLETEWQRQAGGTDGDVRTAAVRLASTYRIDMATLSRRLRELDIVGPDEAARIRTVRTVRADIVDFDLVVGEELVPDQVPREYAAAVLRLYRAELISQERALDLLFDTWTASELPALPQRHADEIWQYV